MTNRARWGLYISPPAFAVAAFAWVTILGACATRIPAAPTLAALAATPPATATPIPTLNAGPQEPVGTPTPAGVEPVSPTPGATPTPEVVYLAYEVQAGDDAWTIAARHGLTVEALLEANGLAQDEPIHPGQQLRIPPPESRPMATTLEYRVRPGDTFSSIAAGFGISPQALQQANPQIEDSALQVDQVLRVPWDGIHIVGPNDTLSGIAEQYQVTFDQLVQANKERLDFNDLHHIEVGWELHIPDEDGVVARCDPEPSRSAVIQHEVAAGEGLFCLAQKFGLQPPTIINANPHIIGEGGLSAGLALLIPPGDGALYIISEEDEARGVKLDHIVGWYSAYGPLTNVVDWQGAPLPPHLGAGQQLYIPGADPLAGIFDSAWLAPATATPDATAVAGAEGMDDGEGTAVPPSPSGVTFSGPRAWLWDNMVARDDPGYCPYHYGSGWSATLSWPAAGREIEENRHFRPGHEAIDINMPENSPVYAAESGVVIWAGYSSFGGGIVIWLSHGNFWHTSYVHLNEVAVSCGQQVARGALIGYSGMTGTSWPHLHFAVYNESTAYDPFAFLR